MWRSSSSIQQTGCGRCTLPSTGHPRKRVRQLAPDVLKNRGWGSLGWPKTYSPRRGGPLPPPGSHERPGGSKESIARGAELISNAKNPLIWAGGGVISSEASAELTELAEYLQAPVITTGEGRGAITDRHYLSIGSFRFKNDTFFDNEIDNYDLVVAVGTRMAYPQYLKNQKVLQIDIDDEEIGRNYDNTEGINGDAKKSLSELIETLKDRMPPVESKKIEIISIAPIISEAMKRIANSTSVSSLFK